jgi:hypothetical protein
VQRSAPNRSVSFTPQPCLKIFHHEHDRDQKPDPDQSDPDFFYKIAMSLAYNGIASSGESSADFLNFGQQQSELPKELLFLKLWNPSLKRDKRLLKPESINPERYDKQD